MFVELLVPPIWYSKEMSVKEDTDVVEVVTVDNQMFYSPDLGLGIPPRSINKEHIRYYIPGSLAEAHKLVLKSEQNALAEAVKNKNSEAVRLLTNSIKEGDWTSGQD